MASRGQDQEGIQKGIQRGRQEGLQESRQEGRQDGQRKVVLAMLRKGMSTEQVAELTDLTIERVLALQS